MRQAGAVGGRIFLLGEQVHEKATQSRDDSRDLRSRTNCDNVSSAPPSPPPVPLAHTISVFLLVPESLSASLPYLCHCLRLRLRLRLRLLLCLCFPPSLPLSGYTCASADICNCTKTKAFVSIDCLDARGDSALLVSCGLERLRGWSSILLLRRPDIRTQPGPGWRLGQPMCCAAGQLIHTV